MGLNIDDSPEAVDHLSKMKALIHIANEKETEVATHYIDVVLPEIGAVTLDEKVSSENGQSQQASRPLVSRSRGTGSS